MDLSIPQGGKVDDLGSIAFGVIELVLRPADFGYETIDELKLLFEGRPGETVGDFSVRIAEDIESDTFAGDRRSASSAMLGFLADIVGDDPIGSDIQQLINRFFRLLRS